MSRNAKQGVAEQSASGAAFQELGCTSLRSCLSRSKPCGLRGRVEEEEREEVRPLEDCFLPSVLSPSNSLEMASEKAELLPRQDPVLPHALKLPAFNKLAGELLSPLPLPPTELAHPGKRIVLASASPRRADILRTFVRRDLWISSSADAEARAGACTRDRAFHFPRGAQS